MWHGEYIEGDILLGQDEDGYRYYWQPIWAKEDLTQDNGQPSPIIYYTEAGEEGNRDCHEMREIPSNIWAAICYEKLKGGRE